MRKLIVISLLLLFTSSQLGYYCVYSYQQYRIRGEIKEQLVENIPDSSQDFFVTEIHDPSIKWEEKGKEFYLHGVLYDVVRIKRINGKTMLYCINDKKENKLLVDFAKAIRSHTDSNSNGKGKQAIKFQASDYFVNMTEKTSFFFNDADHKYLVFNVNIFAIVKDVNSPPPRSSMQLLI